MVFFVWLLSLSIMFMRFVHVVARVSTSFLFIAIFYFMDATFSLSIYELTDIWIISPFLWL